MIENNTNPELEKSLEVIRELLSIIDWVSADSYERECIAPQINEANMFLKNFIAEPITDAEIPLTHSVFRHRTNNSLVCHAWNKADAAKLFNCTRREVMLIQEHERAHGDKVCGKIITEKHPKYCFFSILPERL